MENRETHFSWLRTRMSAERTLMSAIRTAAALIGSGSRSSNFSIAST
jgi:putative membrane protein